jgi:eukaryotic-like serine/threonine-protein kinase
MAEIYRATDTELGRDVAVKVLAEHIAEDEDLRARFLCEGLAAARLSGEPHTVSIYDVGELDGRPFIVMEYLGGGSLADRLGNGTVPQTQALVWLEQAARALDAAHARGVVHRDVKPGNLLLDESDNVHVADFGIARAEGLESNTQTGVVLGTAGYLAPEQEHGVRATPASDRYALGVVAYQLLAGARPGETPGRNLPPRADAVFARALATRPEDRFGSCLEFVAALRAALEAVEAQTVVIRRRERRRRAPALIALAFALGLLGAILAFGLSGRGKPTPAAPPVVRTVTVPAPKRAQPAAAVQREDVEGNATERPRWRGHGKGHDKKAKKAKKAKKD